ncbi:MAG: C40 family peptidase [Clostridium sp.]|nr:C40 family peptidase [Clostridium sp.]
MNILLLIAAALFMLAVATGCGTRRHGIATTSRTGQKPVPSHIPIDPSSMSAPTVQLLSEADTWLGVPYRYGGEDRSGIDCSALVLQIYGRSLSIRVPRNSLKQYEFCDRIDRKDLIPGDLVFFSTPSSKSIGHVGIYVGDDMMVHASSSRGVTVSAITSDYYRRHFKGAGRVGSYYAMVDTASLPRISAPVALPTAPENSPEQPILVAATDSVSESVIVADPRASVLDRYREQPIDSVLNAYFE